MHAYIYTHTLTLTHSYIQAAAVRFVNYWNEKYKLWGDRAFGILTLQDFSPEDQTAIESGGLQYLSEKDAARRGILVFDRNLYDQRLDRRRSMVSAGRYIQ